MSHPVSGTFAIGGSRALSLAGQALAAHATHLLLAAGYRLTVGCCLGADQAVINAAVAIRAARQLHVLTAFGPVVASRAGYAAAGTYRLSAVSAIAAARAAGARITPWAGGPVDLPLANRLACRTTRVSTFANVGGLVVLDGPIGPGSLRLVAAVARRGLPCWALTLDPGQSPGRGWVKGQLGPLPAWSLAGIGPSRLDLDVAPAAAGTTRSATYALSPCF